LTVLFLTSCEGEKKSVFNENGITEGVINYTVSYPYLDSNDLGLNILPKSMDFTFKNNKYRIESIGGMGLFAAGYVSDNEKLEMDYFLKMISSKFVSRFNEKGVKKLHKEFPAFRLEKIDSNKTIAGYNCKGLRVVYYSNVVKDHNMWFTTDINNPGVNWCSPFPEIEGVLLEYQIQRDGLVINFVANTVNGDKVDDDKFKIPVNYKVIPNRALVRKMEEAFWVSTIDFFTIPCL